MKSFRSKGQVAAFVAAFTFPLLPFLSAQDTPAEPEKEMTPEEEEAEFMAYIEKEIDWKREGSGEIGSFATVAIPDGYRFTGAKGTEDLMVIYGNPPGDGYRKGYISPEKMDSWFAIFMWDDRGYVKDDDKDELDPDKLLEQLKEQNKAASAAREKAGYGRLDLVGWAYPPTYNEVTNNLEWALDLVDGNGEHVVNYQTKILGRKGLIEAVLVCAPEELDSYLPDFQSMLSGLEYTSGNKYSEYSAGDKVAKGGLIALIAGGAVFAAAKTGLFATILAFGKKLWYIVLAGVAAVVNWVKRLFGRNSEA